MKLFFNIFRKQVVSYILDQLAKEETKAKWVEAINKAIDIPALDETQESTIYKGVIDKGFEEFKNIINSIK